MPKPPQKPHMTLAAALAALALSVLPVTTAGAEDQPPRSAWHCLPENTIAAVRIPHGRALADALRDNTKLGTVMFSQERIEKLKTMIKEQDPDQWEQVNQTLADYNLTMDDFPQILSGESGAGVVLQKQEGRVAVLAWVEPGEELAGRLINAVKKLIDDHEDDENPMTRVDIELAGRQVIHMTRPQTIYLSPEVELEWPDNFHELNEQEQQEIINGFQQAQQVEMKEQVVQESTLVTRWGGRLLAGEMIHDAHDEIDEADIEWLTEVFARFLAAHEGDEEGFVGRLNSNPHVGRVMAGDGIAMMELLVDVKGLLALAQSVDSPHPQRVTKALGLDGLGAVAVRGTLDGTIARSNMFIEAPAPRAGAVALLDQRELPAEVPAWVPSGILDYSHVSFDLGGFYRTIKDMVLAEYGPEGEMYFQMIEMQAMQFAGTDMASVLSSFGHKHAFLRFEPVLDLQEEDNNPFTQSMNGRFAVVWRVTDEAIWTQLMQNLTQFAMMSNGAMQQTEEQGFTGWRMNRGQMNPEGGLVVGKGYLVLAMGQGVLEQVLTALNSPPAGKDALRTSPIFKRAQQIVQLEPGITLQVSDGNRATKAMVKTVRQMLEQAVDNGPLEDFEFFEQLQMLIPEDEQLENILGVGAGFMRVNEHGLVITGASELPAPD